MSGEKRLTSLLFVKQNGLCGDCGCQLGWGSAKHEIKFRSQGGTPTDEKNTILLCLKCHSARHGIRGELKLIAIIYIAIALFILWAIGYGVIYVTQYAINYNQQIEGVK